jgi:hypothetical protein
VWAQDGETESDRTMTDTEKWGSSRTRLVIFIKSRRMRWAWTKKIQKNLKSKNLDKRLLEHKALMKRRGMDSTGLAYELVAESFEIGNDPSEYQTRWRIS